MLLPASLCLLRIPKPDAKRHMHASRPKGLPPCTQPPPLPCHACPSLLSWPLQRAQLKMIGFTIPLLMWLGLLGVVGLALLSGPPLSRIAANICRASYTSQGRTITYTASCAARS